MHALINAYFNYHPQHNPVLKELNLAYNGFADKGAAALADALKVNSTLIELDVRLCIHKHRSEMDRLRYL